MRRAGGQAGGRGVTKGHTGTHRVALRVLAAIVLVLPACPTTRLRAQVTVHAQAIPLLTRAWHTPGDETRTEVAVTQPTVMLAWDLPGDKARAIRFALRATLDAEGVTIADGELAPGDYGEGFYDRRHPHTYLHELVASAYDLLGGRDGELRLSVTAGKGFVAFGTDDPMSRPAVRYPVNHHLAQILERALVIGRVQYRGAMIERSWFNGDEPTGPGDLPAWDRRFDSDAWRFTLALPEGLEAQYSAARVRSPEQEAGAGSTQHKRSASLRYAAAPGGHPVQALLEWARTEEAGGAFVYRSLLAEGAVTLGRHRPYLRFERTDRPEETRTLDPFRSVRPHLDDSNLGITRWTVWTAGYAHAIRAVGGRLELRPFVEGSVAHVTARTGIFSPTAWYGSDVLPSATLGVKVGWGGMSGMRMGPYAAPPAAPHHHTMEMDHE